MIQKKTYMKEHIGKILLIIFSLVLLVGMIWQEIVPKQETEEMAIFFEVGEEVIRAWEKDGVYYLFLPSCAIKKEIAPTSYSAKIVLEKDGETFFVDNNLEKLENGEKVPGQFVETGQKLEFCVLQSENIPAVFIETKLSELDELKSDKELEVSGYVVSVEADGKRSDKIAIKTIGGRGNTSFAGYDKKPFSITLERESKLLELPLGQNYVLISNASDPSLVRNDLARRMEIAMGLPYAQTGEFVDLYVNGEYEGNYYLCSNVEIGTERINIENMEAAMDLFYQNSSYESEELYETNLVKARELEVYPEDITGGYLLEREYIDRYKLEYEIMGSGFVTENQEHFVVKSPRFCSVEQIEYISNYVNEVEKSILNDKGINEDTQKGYADYLDVDSFVKKYLVEEVTKNYDGGVSSSFYYKDRESNGGKLVAGPGWDYDMSLGNYVDWMEEFSADPTGISKLEHHTYATFWYTKLYEKPEFYEKVKTNYREYVAPFLERMLTKGLAVYWEELEASSKMNHIRWAEELKENPYYKKREDTFQDLKKFISQRKAYLDEAWGVD